MSSGDACCPAMVTCEWLNTQLSKDNPDIKVLDTTFTEKGPGLDDFKTNHIPSAQFINITSVSRPEPFIPTCIPTTEDFQKELRALGINANSHVILYESAKLLPFTAPRLWWMLRAFGHRKVSVMNGGLAKWQAEGFPVTAEIQPVKEGDITLSPDHSLMVTYEKLLEIQTKGSHQILDTRPHENYTGKEQEPSALLRMILPAVGIPDVDSVHVKTGAMPGAKNLPYPLLYSSDLISTRPVNELQELFTWAGVDLSKPLMTTCYVGYTACSVAMAAHLCGNPNVAVYYGSWVEYGQRASEDQVKPGPQAEVEPPYNIQFPGAQL